MNADTQQVHAQTIARITATWATLPAEKVRGACRTFCEQLEDAAFRLYEAKLAKGERVASKADAPAPVSPKTDGVSGPGLGATPASIVAGIPAAPTVPPPPVTTTTTTSAPPAGGIVEAPVENPKEPKE